MNLKLEFIVAFFGFIYYWSLDLAPHSDDEPRSRLEMPRPSLIYVISQEDLNIINKKLKVISVNI